MNIFEGPLFRLSQHLSDHWVVRLCCRLEYNMSGAKAKGQSCHPEKKPVRDLRSLRTDNAQTKLK